ncbi:MAG: HTH-type transcriptional regulator DmlR [Stenotrophomonas maltophilia]|nr:MAG: HTH-type transcriptional regulator DmlR [Stenotrophomonas maltophilia]
MNNLPALDDLRVFIAVARRAGFAAAAAELGMSPAFVTKRIKVLEGTLGVKLLHRSTRRVSVSEEGERVYAWAVQMIESVQRLGEELSQAQGEPAGPLRIVSSQGMGRRFVAPALSELARRYPRLDIRLEVHDRLVDLAGEGFDLDIRVGNAFAPNLIAKPLARSRRILCASPAYLAHAGEPRSPAELASHNCLLIKERDRPFGVWSLQGPQDEVTVKITGSLSTNHGEIARQWCVDGQGILLRSWWDVSEYMERGLLVPVLPEYYQSADIWAVHTAPLSSSAKLKVTVDFLREYFAERYAMPGQPAAR